MNPALIAAIPSAFQTIYGITQASRAAAGLRNLKRPEYSMPGEVGNVLALNAAAYADPYSVGEQRAQANIGQTTANAAAQARDSGMGAAMAAAIAGQANSGYNQLQVQVEQDRENRRRSLEGALSTVAQYRDLEWQMNKFAPFADKQSELRQMHGAGMQNIMGGIDGLSAIGVNNALSRSASPAPTPQAAATAATGIQSNAATLQDVFGYMANKFMSSTQSGPGAAMMQMASRPFILPF